MQLAAPMLTKPSLLQGMYEDSVKSQRFGRESSFDLANNVRRERERRSSWRHNIEARCCWVSTNTLSHLYIISILSYIYCSHKIRLAAVNGVSSFVFISFASYVCNPYVGCVCVRMCVGDARYHF